jgi:hypothetical protein
MRILVALLMISVIGAVVACSESTNDATNAIAGRWEKIGGRLVDRLVEDREGKEIWHSLVIYEDGKLTTDASCSGTAEPAGNGLSRLTFDCALGSVICDVRLVSDVKEVQSYTDENGDEQEGYFAYDEVLEMTCPDDDTYVFAREKQVPGTDVRPTPSAS